MQAYGDNVEWIPDNKSLQTYLTMLRSDPYTPSIEIRI